MAKASFTLGQLVATRGVSDRMASDREFYRFVWDSLEKYTHMDWGDSPDEDKKQNDMSVLYRERIFAVYKREGFEDDTIWIITEWDRSATTVLFPDEY